MSPKTDRSILLKARLDFETNNFKSISELAKRYSINEKTLSGRIAREGWKEKREELSSKIESKLKEKVLSRADTYLSSLQSRVEKYEKIIDASMENLGSKTVEGIPLLDPEAIDQFTRSEGRIQAIGAFAHRIPAQTSVDVSSGGESLIAIIERLRSDPKTLDLSPAQVDYIASCDVEAKGT